MTGTTAGAEQVDGGPARIDELRGSIDVLDRQIVHLLAERTAVVRQLTEFKRDEETVRSPGRVEQVISKVRRLAEDEGMPPGIAEATYRTLIAELTDLQMSRLAERRAAPASASSPASASASGPASVSGPVLASASASAPPEGAA